VDRIQHVQLQLLTLLVTPRADDERGASLVEYALLVALIAVVCVGAVRFLGASTPSNLSHVGSTLGG
jgi:pilus assembly protein Flp/PilA